MSVQQQQMQRMEPAGAQQYEEQTEEAMEVKFRCYFIDATSCCCSSSEASLALDDDDSEHSIIGVHLT